jgi:hypothetical protein
MAAAKKSKKSASKKSASKKAGKGIRCQTAKGKFVKCSSPRAVKRISVAKKRKSKKG